MERPLVTLERRSDGRADVVLDDPERRNALGERMFDQLDAAVSALADDAAARVVVLAGAGPAFCAGFDLGAAVASPGLMATFIRRLSRLNRAIRRLPQPVVAVVHGAALAGGCALVSACDLVVVAADAQLGYPVHRIGVSPAVTLPLLAAAIGTGPARALVLSGDLVDGSQARSIGLATHLASDAAGARAEADRLVASLLAKGPRALRATKAWLNELDGSLDDARFDATAEGSAALAGGEEAVRLLESFWSRRRASAAR